MKQPYYSLTEEFRHQVITLFNTLDIFKLYQKESCSGEWQRYSVSNEYCVIEIKQKRLYSAEQSYKTNTEGVIFIHIEDYKGNECDYEYPQFLKLINWDYPDRNFRIIIPNTLLSSLKQFINVAIVRNLPTVSTK